MAQSGALGISKTLANELPVRGSNITAPANASGKMPAVEAAGDSERGQ
jgi:hypothetical protein